MKSGGCDAPLEIGRIGLRAYKRRFSDTHFGYFLQYTEGRRCRFPKKLK